MIQAQLPTSLVFEWTGHHDVYLMPDKPAFDDCNFSQAILLGDASPFTYTRWTSDSDTLYFSCSVAAHCENGQKLSVDVSTYSPTSTPTERSRMLPTTQRPTATPTAPADPTNAPTTAPTPRFCTEPVTAYPCVLRPGVANLPASSSNTLIRLTQLLETGDHMPLARSYEGGDWESITHQTQIALGATRRTEPG